jgi:hypothetical protein
MDTPIESAAEFRERIKEERRADRVAAKAFVRVCMTGDADLVEVAASLLDAETITGWTIAIRKIAREVSEVSPDVRSAFLSVWIQRKMLPLTVGDHRALCTAARVLMPPYSGPPLRLFRGASAGERRRRIYGISWTSDMAIAETFAQERRRWNGGSVLLETVAPPGAIICAISQASGNLYEESEFAVDRRDLHTVRVLRRYERADSARLTDPAPTSAVPNDDPSGRG